MNCCSVAILPTLEAAGVPRSGITVLIATGLHRPNLGAEIVELVGPDVAANYRVENHYGKDLASHTDLGTSARGACRFTSIHGTSAPTSKSPPD